MEIIVIALSIFICITLSGIGVYWLASNPRSATSQRLDQLDQSRSGTVSVGNSIIEPDPVSKLVERVTTPLQRFVPPSPAEARKLQRLLMQAGYRSPSAPLVYRAIQLIALFSFPSVVLMIFMMQARPLRSVVIWSLLAFVLGFFLPRFFLRRIIQKRQLMVRWGLADALDLMVISIEAGLGLNAAMVRVSEELKVVHPDICEELELTNLEMRVGRERDEALRNLAERTGVDDLRSFVAMLIQADRFGTSIAKAVRIYADALRVKRRQRAEQAAQKAAVKLLFPLACFLFPTLFIAVLGPAMISLMDVFAKIGGR